MNQFGVASQGKLIEEEREDLYRRARFPVHRTGFHGDSAKMYKSMLDGLEYRGAAFYQCYTTCQPEHGVPDMEC